MGKRTVPLQFDVFFGPSNQQSRHFVDEGGRDSNVWPGAGSCRLRNVYVPLLAGVPRRPSLTYMRWSPRTGRVLTSRKPSNTHTHTLTHTHAPCFSALVDGLTVEAAGPAASCWRQLCFVPRTGEQPPSDCSHPPTLSLFMQ